MSLEIVNSINLNINRYLWYWRMLPNSQILKSQFYQFDHINHKTPHKINFVHVQLILDLFGIWVRVFFSTQALSGPWGGQIEVHKWDAAGDQVQRASQHHLQQPDQPQRTVTSCNQESRASWHNHHHQYVTIVTLKSTKIGPVLRTNVREQYGTSTSKFCVNIQYSGAGPQLLCTTMKIQPKSMHLLKFLKYLNKSVWPNCLFLFLFSLFQLE